MIAAGYSPQNLCGTLLRRSAISAYLPLNRVQPVGLAKNLSVTQPMISDLNDY